MRKKFRRNMLLGVVVVGLVCCLNHAEYGLRVRSAPLTTTQGGGVVIEQEGGYTGHEVIGVQEVQLPDRDDVLKFSVLAQWEYPKPVPCPDTIMALSHKEVAVAGFMYPLEPGARVKTFCLLRNTQTCCYGARPQFNQYILVEMPEPVAFERLSPVVVRGTFYVEPNLDEGYIYRMEGTSFRTTHDNDPDPLFGFRQPQTNTKESAGPDRGPVIPVPVEVLAVVAVLLGALAR